MQIAKKEDVRQRQMNDYQELMRMMEFMCGSNENRTKKMIDERSPFSTENFQIMSSASGEYPDIP